MNETTLESDERAAATIRRTVTRAMNERHLTYHEACGLLGIRNISRIHWLRNTIRHWPEPELFARLCTAFDLDPKDLLREAGYLHSGARAEAPKQTDLEGRTDPENPSES